MQAIETLEHFYEALTEIVAAHTSLDRKEIGDAITIALAGHPREAAIKLLLDGLLSGSNNLDGRVAAAAEIKRLSAEPYPDTTGPEGVAEKEPCSPPKPLAIETVHYADGASATGAAPLPDHSPEGAPAIESCNVADITRGRCTLALGHTVDHAFENPEAKPASEVLAEAKAEVAARAGFEKLDAEAVAAAQQEQLSEVQATDSPAVPEVPHVPESLQE